VRVSDRPADADPQVRTRQGREFSAFIETVCCADLALDSLESIRRLSFHTVEMERAWLGSGHVAVDVIDVGASAALGRIATKYRQSQRSKLTALPIFKGHLVEGVSDYRPRLVWAGRSYQVGGLGARPIKDLSC